VQKLSNSCNHAQQTFNRDDDDDDAVTNVNTWLD